MEGELVCALCCSTLSNPKLLDCLHSFCAGCLQQRSASDISKEGQICCPQCQWVTILPVQGGVDELCADFLVANALALQKLRDGQQLIRCTMCGDDDDDEESEAATHRCGDCQIFLCELHAAAHRKAKKTSSHRMLPVEALRTRRCGATSSADFAHVRRAPQCHRHEKEAELFCEQCQKLVCRDCILVEHRDHNYAFVRDTAPKHRAAIEASLTSMKREVLAMDSVQKLVKGTQSSLHTRAEDVCDEIRAMSRHHQAMIVKRERWLLDEVGRVCSTKSRRLEEQSRRLTQLLSALSHSKAFFDRVLEESSDQEMAGVKASLVSHANALIAWSEKEPRTATDDGRMNFAFTQECQRSIASLGSVTTPASATHSYLEFPPTALAHRPVRGKVILRDSLGQPWVGKAGGSGSPCDDLTVFSKPHTILSDNHGDEMEVPSLTPACDAGHLTVTTRGRSYAEGPLYVTATIREEHLQGSPVTVNIKAPPWTLACEQFLPSWAKQCVEITDGGLTIPLRRQELEQQHTHQGYGMYDSQRSFLHVYGSTTLSRQSQPQALTWRVSWSRSAAGDSSQAKQNQQQQQGQKKRSKQRQRQSISRRMDARMEQTANSSQAEAVSAVGVVNASFFPDPESGSAHSFGYLQESGYSSFDYCSHPSSLSTHHVYNNGTCVPDHGQHRCTRDWRLVAVVEDDDARDLPTEEEELRWTADDTLLLSLAIDARGDTASLTVHNLSTRARKTLNQISLPCRPYIALSTAKSPFDCIMLDF